MEGKEPHLCSFPVESVSGRKQEAQRANFPHEMITFDAYYCQVALNWKEGYVLMNGSADVEIKFLQSTKDKHAHTHTCVLTLV